MARALEGLCTVRERPTDRLEGEREFLCMCVFVCCSPEISRPSWFDRLPETERRKNKKTQNVTSERKQEKKDRKVTVISESQRERRENGGRERKLNEAACSAQQEIKGKKK